MSVIDEIRDAIGTDVFGALRDDFMLETTDRLFLCKASDEVNEYEVVGEVTDKWFFDGKQVSIFDNSDELTSWMLKTTHIRLNDTVYAITLADNDTPPISGRIGWVADCERVVTRTAHSELY